jgi:hypothetical protein
MLEFIMMLIALAFGNHNANTQSCNNDNNGQPTTQLTNPSGGTDPTTGTDPGGSEGDTGGETGQTPPPPKK